jgi:hypothetical protein
VVDGADVLAGVVEDFHMLADLVGVDHIGLGANRRG